MQTFFRRLFYWISYYQKPPWDSGISPPELVEFLNEHPAGRAIDLGCGTGTNVITLAEHGWQVTGIDFIPRAIKTARRKIKKAGVQAVLIAGDVTRLEHLGDPFNLALDIGCYHNLGPSGKQAYENNLNSLLANGGTYLLYGFLFTPENTFGITEVDLERLQTFLTLSRRQDGNDRHRPSAWFWFTHSDAKAAYTEAGG